VDLYLDTLYSAFEMIASGVTTVQHIQSLLPGTAGEVRDKIGQIIKAYEDIGMRVSYCYGLRDQNRLVYQADEALVASLPPELREPLRRHFARFPLGLDDMMGLFRDLFRQHAGKPRVKVQLAPANLHWCSDKALETTFDGAIVEAMQTALVAEDPIARAVPYMLSAGTDAKSFADLGIRCFGFAPLKLPPELDFAGMFHGVDERVPVDGLKFGVRVLDRFIEAS